MRGEAASLGSHYNKIRLLNLPQPKVTVEQDELGQKTTFSFDWPETADSQHMRLHAALDEASEQIKAARISATIEPFEVASEKMVRNRRLSRRSRREAVGGTVQTLVLLLPLPRL